MKHERALRTTFVTHMSQKSTPLVKPNSEREK